MSNEKEKDWFSALLARLYANINVHPRLKKFITDLFIRITFFQTLEKLEADLYSERQASSERTKRIQSALFSKNTLIAALGLGFAYVFIHIFEIYLVLGGLALGFIAAPLALYLVTALWQARATFIRNLMYEENKAFYKAKIECSTKKYSLIQFKRAFEQRHAELISYYSMQRKLEPVKKFSRTLMLFTTIFALEAAKVMFSGFLLPSLLAATLVAILDYRSKEIPHDLKLRYLHEQLVAMKSIELETLEKSSELKNLQQQLQEQKRQEIDTAPTALPVSSVSPNTSQLGFKWADYFLCFIGITSAYVAIGFATIFNFHEIGALKGNAIIDLGLGGLTAADAMLFGAAGLVAIGIMIWNMWQTHKLYQFYAKEELRLLQITQKLKFENSQIRTQLRKKNPLTATSTNSETETLSAYNASAKKQLNMSEGNKKSVRIVFYLVAFGLINANPLGIGGIALIILTAIIIGCLDYWVRQKKTAFENKINELKKEQLDLLEEKKSLYKAYKTEPFVSLQPVSLQPRSLQRSRSEPSLSTRYPLTPTLLARRLSATFPSRTPTSLLDTNTPTPLDSRPTTPSSSSTNPHITPAVTNATSSP